MTDLLLLDAEVAGARTDALVRDGRIVALGVDRRTEKPSRIFDCGGGAVIPALHDHHVHLLSLAAAAHSVAAGPPTVRNSRQLADVLRLAAARAGSVGWIRATGYHESVAGELDRWRLDAMVPDHPVRLQHRSGALWILNSRALQEIGAVSGVIEGVEAAATGELTGRLFRVDDWLRGRLPPSAPLELGAVSERLARYGVAGVTDMTPYDSWADVCALADAVRRAHRAPRVTATGGPELAGHTMPAPLRTGPVKVILDDVRLPSFAQLCGAIRAAHGHRRTIAFHCVTEPSAALVAAGLREAGTVPGDRIEHGSVIGGALIPALASLGATIVTQPGFVGERGDQYLDELDGDLADLYRCASLIAAGVPVGGGTDAPFADADPWRAMRVAVSRRTPSGEVLGPAEAVSPARALALFTARAEDPGGAPRRVAVGEPADLCVLRVPLAAALADLTSDHVAATIASGRILYSAGEAA